ncbi:AraC family transcriptional regulator [Actinomadura darangshiensis]|uniref:AraC family transcriptional regulator n=1 Tax=Actinomadura darangshiensis TaxID=705336 RepID=A0A4R5BF82_9ACTN|nr:helix-turn-helix transcriptional regulator [Actinomadura darangshiensis]TDD84049.1 AraC family transcriptional regulator [Actinomadura darangshiensis]
MDEFSPSDIARLSALPLDVLTVALGNALAAERAVPAHPVHARRGALMAQIYAFMRKNLGDPHLTPGVIAEAHYISLRYLHKLFQQEGQTVAGWVRERRLELCRRDLADPGLTALSISAIACRWGYRNPAHFSQAFRSAYGLSPRQFRRQHATLRRLRDRPVSEGRPEAAVRPAWARALDDTASLAVRFVPGT